MVSEGQERPSAIWAHLRDTAGPVPVIHCENKGSQYVFWFLGTFVMLMLNYSFLCAVALCQGKKVHN